MQKSIKEEVVKSYSELAKSTKKKSIVSKLFSCCDPNEATNKVAKAIGYSDEVLEAIPKDANLGVSCGNPSALAAIKKGETVIDLGSGAGFDAFVVSPLVGKHGKVIGIDLSDEMIELARKNATKESDSNIEFIKGDIEQLPLNDAIADHVISNCVINLSLNKGEVFKEAYRVLKVGGKLSISDIVLEKSLPNFIKNTLAGHIACVAGAESVESYLSYVSAAGFKAIKIESKSEFPIELMLADPTIMKIAESMNFALDSKQAKDLAARVTSISLSAIK